MSENVPRSGVNFRQNLVSEEIGFTGAKVSPQGVTLATHPHRVIAIPLVVTRRQTRVHRQELDECFIDFLLVALHP
jgi:hypothetical protein